MRTAQAAMTAALALTLTLAAGACSRSSSEPKKDASDRGAGRLAYARCMRDHGVPVPDPQGDGNLQIPEDASPEAEKACAPHLGGRGDEAAANGPDLGVAEQQALLAYAKCMRAQGRDFPDPVFNGGSAAQLGDGKTAVDVTSPEYVAADAACRRELNAAGMEPPR